VEVSEGGDGDLMNSIGEHSVGVNEVLGEPVTCARLAAALARVTQGWTDAGLR